MKRIILFFAVCLGLSVFQTETVFAVQNTRTQTTTKRESVKNTSSRPIVTTQQQKQTSSDVKSRTTATPSRVVQAPKNKSAKTTQSVKQRASVTQQRKPDVSSSKKTSVSARTTATTPAKRVTASRTSATRTPVRAAITGKAKSTSLDSDKISDIKSKDYSKCKSVYYECMDEFCANKDSNLGRCACSTRIHEFDKIKKQLSDAEDKMLDFNQRLLTVSLDKEDAAAINVATEGELAFNTKDKSESEKLLQKISKNLNTSTDSKINNDLSAVSLSLNIDSAWDTVDAVSGISTTSKTGIDLYNAAQPVCLDMAREVCSEDELNIAQGGYKLTIQQDCNTVAKSYDTQYNRAMEKIHESSALLDISRLNAYQQRNSDDILTCKKKILDQLSTDAVCGANLYKCLDTTGQYINPSTGAAFLTPNLHDLTTLLKAPEGEETWSKVAQNEKFVAFLNSKKEFLTPATEQCQDIAEIVWKDFLNDALAQIKLAQNAKLEEIKQSCTTLVAECKSGTQDKLADFDLRALTTFNLLTDKTVNALCADVQNSCVELLRYSDIDNSNLWEQGITQIVTDTTYDAIIDTCTTIGRDCIIRQCNGTNGNFALCRNFTSTPRRAILTRQACWDEVLNCVKSADNLNNMHPLAANKINFYKTTYGWNDTDYGSLFNMATTEQAITDQIPTLCSDDDIACLITEQIWGNCDAESDSSTAITTNPSVIGAIAQQGNHNLTVLTQNKILLPINDEDTLLSWFAKGTETDENIDSCSVSTCPVDYIYSPTGRTCSQIMVQTLSDGEVAFYSDEILYVTSGINEITNLCPGGNTQKDKYGNCCANAVDTTYKICIPKSNDYSYAAHFVQKVVCNANMSSYTDPLSAYYCTDNTEKTMFLYYVAPVMPSAMTVLKLVGTQLQPYRNVNLGEYWVLVDQYGNYITPADGSSSLPGPKMRFKIQNETTSCTYTYSYSGNTWTWDMSGTGCQTILNDGVPKNNHFKIEYPN